MPRKDVSRSTRPNGLSRRKHDPAARDARPIFSDDSGDESLLRALLEGLEIGVANVTGAGRILYANSRFIGMLGVRRLETVTGSVLSRFISPASWPALQKALAQGMERPVQAEMGIDNPAGSVRTVQLSLVPIRGVGGPTVMIAATEITELLEKNRAFEATQEALHSLSARILRLQDEERRRIARDLHDITGQELAVIIMSLNQLATNLGKPEVNAQQTLSEAVALVRKVEDEIRTLSYVLHPPLLDEFGLRSALSWYAEGFAKRSGIKVTLDIPHELPRFSTEKEMALFRVVQESLTNVLRHSKSSKAHIRMQIRSNQVHLCVYDEGQGISREALAKISEGTATGVGTQGMRERIQQLGGTLRFSARAKGTQVMATLPIDVTKLAGAEPETPQPADGTGSSARISKIKRILIADDHDVTRQGVRTLLKGEPNIEICGEAENGAEAVAKARELDPDLVIMDLSMPGASGFSAATHLRNAGSRAKILFFTTHNYGEIERTSRACGFEGLVTKTNATRDLVRAIRAILAGKRFYNSEVLQEGGVKTGSKRARSGSASV